MISGTTAYTHDRAAGVDVLAPVHCGTGWGAVTTESCVQADGVNQAPHSSQKISAGIQSR